MIKKILLTIVAIVIVVSVFLFRSTVDAIVGVFSANTSLIPIIIVAVIVQFIGHIYRARRTKLVLDQAASSSLRFQFGVLSIGYLFNTVFALRIGELARAILVARRLRISFLYTFVAILIERSTDVIFLSTLIILFVIFSGGAVTGSLALVAAFGGMIALLAIVGVILLKNENRILLKMISAISHLFNNRINNSIRFKVWSLIFGLQNFFDNKEYVRRYIVYAAVSWLCYIASTLIILVPLLSTAGVSSIVLTTISSYVVSLPGLIDLTLQTFNSVATLLYLNVASLSSFNVTAILWTVLVLPIAAVGFVSLALYRTRNKKGTIQVHPDAYTNKLLRYDDISQDFPAFLETYFKGYGLSRVLHKIEVNGELSLVKFFKGGSDAVTVLALKDSKLFVKKIVPAEYTNRLKVQYDWLRKFDNKKSIVSVTSQQQTDDYYAIDLEYNPNNISLFEYFHTHSLQQSKAILDKVWAYVFDNIYTIEKEKAHTRALNEYVEDRLLNKMKKAITENDDLATIIKEDMIRINGKTYDNFYQIIDKIKNHKEAWKNLATYRESKVAHGDLTVDNILVNTIDASPYIIDPSDDNQVKGPIIDFARHTQSLAVGYEFLNDDEDPIYLTEDGGLVAINYHDRRSARYMQLGDYFSKNLSKKYFTDNERKIVLFHTGLLYGRMLTHRVVINPGNTLKYYAVCIMLLNDFYEQYR